MTKYVDGIHFVTEECCSCGMPFSMTLDFQKRRLKDRGWFYCPRGHQQHYTGKSEEQKLRDQLEKRENDLDAERGRAAALAAQRDAISKSYTRMRDRVKNGVCPCCNRTFQNLLMHMKTEHPEFGEHEQLRALRDAFGLTQSALADEIGVSAPYISRFENKKPVPAWADHSIARWINSNA